MTVPGLLPGNNMRPAHTCDGANVSVPVRWTGIPKGTAELALFVVSFQPVHGNFFVDWAVAGLQPDSSGLAAGKLPAGAVVGRNSYGQTGYSICPPKGTRETYAVKVLALPGQLELRPGFNAVAFYRLAEHKALAGSFAGMTYIRR